MLIPFLPALWHTWWSTRAAWGLLSNSVSGWSTPLLSIHQADDGFGRAAWGLLSNSVSGWSTLLSIHQADDGFARLLSIISSRRFWDIDGLGLGSGGITLRWRGNTMTGPVRLVMIGLGIGMTDGKLETERDCDTKAFKQTVYVARCSEKFLWIPSRESTTCPSSAQLLSSTSALLRSITKVRSWNSKICSKCAVTLEWDQIWFQVPLLSRLIKFCVFAVCPASWLMKFGAWAYCTRIGQSTCLLYGPLVGSSVFAFMLIITLVGLANLVSLFFGLSYA